MRLKNMIFFFLAISQTFCCNFSVIERTQFLHFFRLFKNGKSSTICLWKWITEDLSHSRFWPKSSIYVNCDSQTFCSCPPPILRKSHSKKFYNTSVIHRRLAVKNVKGVNKMLLFTMCESQFFCCIFCKLVSTHKSLLFLKDNVI